MKVHCSRNKRFTQNSERNFIFNSTEAFKCYSLVLCNIYGKGLSGAVRQSIIILHANFVIEKSSKLSFLMDIGDAKNK